MQSLYGVKKNKKIKEVGSLQNLESEVCLTDCIQRIKLNTMMLFMLEEKLHAHLQLVNLLILR